MTASQRQAVLEWARDRMPDDVRRLRRLALWDLHYGPSLEGMAEDEDGPDYPGFAAACGQIRAFADEHLPDLYVDDSDECWESVPREVCPVCDGDGCSNCDRGYVYSNSSCVDSSLVRTIAFGPLAEYL